jgi:hypothetical protein
MSANPTTARTRNFMPILGAIILASVGLYYAFWALNSLGLENRSAVATITGKEHFHSGTSYQAQNIGGRNFVRQLRTPEAWVLRLKLENEEAFAAVEKGFYDTLNSNDQVRVTYQRRRITAALQVSHVTAVEKGGNP